MLNSGSYRLHIYIYKDMEIEVGALGKYFFLAGKYIYSGSAMKNLNQRVLRHKSSKKKIRWHIDYLLNSENVELQHIDVFPSEKREECNLNAELLKLPGSEIPVRGFGSSDCRICPAHLVYFGK